MNNFQTKANTPHRKSDLPSSLPGYKTFSLVLWKNAVEILKTKRKLSVFALAAMLGCTEGTAEGIVTDYRKLKRRTPKSPKGDLNTKWKQQLRKQ